MTIHRGGPTLSAGVHILASAMRGSIADRMTRRYSRLNISPSFAGTFAPERTPCNA